MLQKLLTQGLQALNLQLTSSETQKLASFVLLLEKWNQAYNLTAVRDPLQMVTRHILDSLAIAPFVRGPRVLDIGTGAGLPGIPLAVVAPEQEFVLLDSNAKKTQFVTQAVGILGLKNVKVVQERVEKYQPAQKFDTLITRAFAGIADMLSGAGHLCNARGQFLAMKGVYPQEEIAGMPAGFQLDKTEALHVPGLDGARHLVIIRPQEAPQQITK